jgi:hypothetical protein
MATSEFERVLNEKTLPVDVLEPPLTLGERIARVVLLTGFILVLGIEAYLIWQGWQLL